MRQTEEGGRKKLRREGEGQLLAFLQAPHFTLLSSTPSNTSVTILRILGGPGGREGEREGGRERWRERGQGGREGETNRLLSISHV